MTEDGYTRLTLAQAMNTNAAKFLGFMKDESFPSFCTFLSLTEFFHCSADFLIGLSDYPKREARYSPAPPFCKQLNKLMLAEKLSIYELHAGTGLSDSVCPPFRACFGSSNSSTILWIIFLDGLPDSSHNKVPFLPFTRFFAASLL